MRGRIASALAVCTLLLAMPVRAQALLDLDWTQRQGRPLPLDAPLRDAEGRATTLRQVSAGLPLVLAPGYFHCPNLCGAVRDDLFAALAGTGLRAGRDYVVALVTIDPAEGPADAARARDGVLDRYPGAEPVHALTGPGASLDAIAAAAGFNNRPDPAAREFLHPAGAVVLTPDGTVSGYLLGLGYGPDAVRTALELARAGGAAPAEPVHLFCFSYDPRTGRFSATVLQLVRGASLLTVAVLGAVLLRAGRRA